MNATIIGTLAGGVLLFLSSILVPVISKRLNKRIDDATSAEKFTVIAEKLTTRLDSRLEKTETQLQDTEVKLSKTETKCNQCLQDLERAIARADRAEHRADKAERRAAQIDRSNAALIDAWTAALPLLDANAGETLALRTAIAAARNARHADPS